MVEVSISEALWDGGQDEKSSNHCPLLARNISGFPGTGLGFTFELEEKPQPEGRQAMGLIK